MGWGQQDERRKFDSDDVRTGPLWSNVGALQTGALPPRVHLQRGLSAMAAPNGHLNARMPVSQVAAPPIPPGSGGAAPRLRQVSGSMRDPSRATTSFSGSW